MSTKMFFVYDEMGNPSQKAYSINELSEMEINGQTYVCEKFGEPVMAKEVPELKEIIIWQPPKMQVLDKHKVVELQKEKSEWTPPVINNPISGTAGKEVQQPSTPTTRRVAVVSSVILLLTIAFFSYHYYQATDDTENIRSLFEQLQYAISSKNNKSNDLGGLLYVPEKLRNKKDIESKYFGLGLYLSLVGEFSDEEGYGYNHKNILEAIRLFSDESYVEVFQYFETPNPERYKELQELMPEIKRENIREGPGKIFLINEKSTFTNRFRLVYWEVSGAERLIRFIKHPEGH